MSAKWQLNKYAKSIVLLNILFNALVIWPNFPIFLYK